MATERIRASTIRTTYRTARRGSRTSATARAVSRRRLLLIAAACLAIWPLFAWAGARLLIVKSEMASADAIVVLSGSSTFVERTDWAARLYREGRAPIIILTNDSLMSGWNNVEDRNPYFYELAAKELRQRGVPAEKIRIVTEIATGTYEESLELREYATAYKLKRLLVVTSAYHSRRALWSLQHACEGSGIEIGIDGPPPGWQTPSPWSWWWHRWGWKVVAGEYAKMIYYWLRY